MLRSNCVKSDKYESLGRGTIVVVPIIQVYQKHLYFCVFPNSSMLIQLYKPRTDKWMQG